MKIVEMSEEYLSKIKHNLIVVWLNGIFVIIYKQCEQVSHSETRTMSVFDSIGEHFNNCLKS